MPAKTPKRDRMIVKTGISNPRILSSFIPHQVAMSMIAIIWNARPEYFAKSLNPLL
jgi:hypothetical protein